MGATVQGRNWQISSEGVLQSPLARYAKRAYQTGVWSTYTSLDKLSCRPEPLAPSYGFISTIDHTDAKYCGYANGTESSAELGCALSRTMALQTSCVPY